MQVESGGVRAESISNLSLLKVKNNIRKRLVYERYGGLHALVLMGSCSYYLLPHRKIHGRRFCQNRSLAI